MHEADYRERKDGLVHYGDDERHRLVVEFAAVAEGAARGEIGHRKCAVLVVVDQAVEPDECRAREVAETLYDAGVGWAFG